MYVRAVKQSNKDGSFREYLQIVESFRDKGRVKQRVLASLGRLGGQITEKKVDQVMESLAKFAGKAQLINILKDLKSQQSKAYGELEIFRRVFKDLGIEKTLRKRLEKTDKVVDYVEAVFVAIGNKLMDAGSKRKASQWKDGVYEPKWEELELHHIYRGMDLLLDRKDEIEGELFDQTRTLFNCKVNVAMFDTTTVSYWGEGKSEIFQRGHAKNKRFDLKQLVVGIVMDQDGTPLGHEVWPGNMSDRPAFRAVVEKIKRKFQIEKVILVCDKGMISEQNIAFLEQEKYEYILGVKMRQLSQIRQRLLLNDDGFQDLYLNGRKGKEMREWELWKKEQIELNDHKKNAQTNPTSSTKSTNSTNSTNATKSPDVLAQEAAVYKESPKGKRRFVVCLNPELAQEDKKKREYFQKILENKVEFNTAKEWIVKNGYKKYVNIHELSITLNYDRLEQDAFYDGKWCLLTNSQLPIISLVSAYKDLGQIERHFRTLKSEIELGPIYHWKERRVRAHVFICFLALQIRAYITKKLKELDPKLSYSDVMRDVSKIRANYYQIKDQLYIQRTEFQGLAHLAFKATGTKIPPEFLHLPKSQSTLENVVTTSA